MVTITMPKFTVSSVAAILAVLVDGGLCLFAGPPPALSRPKLPPSLGRLSSGFTLYGLGEDKSSDSSELTDVFPESNGVQHGTQSDGKNGIDTFNSREYSDFGNEIKRGDDGYEAGAQEPGAQEPGAQEPGAQEPDSQKPGAQEPGGDDDGAGQNYDDDKNASHIAPAKYILGGNATGIAMYPWVVRLEIKLKEGRGDCGGSLVSWRHVITAAHCVDFDIRNDVDVSVYLAEYNTQTFPVDCDGSQCVENVLMHPDKIIIHPQYQGLAMVNDIALLRLCQSAPYTDYIRPIALPTFNINDRIYEGAPVVVTGWGLTEYGQMSPIKLHVLVELVAPETCRHAGRHYRFNLTEGMLCAAGKNGKNKCSGDSGGPLMAQYDGKLHLVGLVSFRLTASCKTSKPSMYTNVYSYLEWIKKSMSD